MKQKQSKPDDRIYKLEDRMNTAEAVMAILVERFPSPLPTNERMAVNQFLERRKAEQAK